MPPALYYTMVHPMASMSARIPDPLALRFEAFASSRGGKSRVLRALMEAALQGSAPGGDVSRSAAGRSSKVTLRLHEEDLAALDEACADARLLRTQWIVALVRRRLLGRPQFDHASAASLLEVRRELRRLGLSLRTMANASDDNGGPAVETVEAFRTEVRDHLERVRRAIGGNLAYWDAPSGE